MAAERGVAKHQKRIARQNRAMPTPMADILNPRLTDNTQPHSFVLADLFDVVSMSLDVPDHILEADLGLEYQDCPDCSGEGWFMTEGFAWSSPDWAFIPRYSFRPCLRCDAEGLVLADTTAALETNDDVVFEFQGIQLRRAA